MKRTGLLDLNEAVQHPGKKLVFEVRSELGQEEDIDLLEPVTGQLQAVSTGNLLLVKAQLRTKTVVECARCTAPLEVDVKFSMDEQFAVEGVPSAYASDSYAYVVTDEPEPLFDHNALILDAFLRQGLLLSLPMQSLCSGDWEVPCPGGEGGAAAKVEDGHPAFRVLGELRHDGETGS
ncbi:MAG: DUF177 domain-containing protein [Fimbriimonadaceae bacterium]|nr:DUF177 domain-containing protein [Fimbriimonadaceae bacterium]QYK56368.1 MAG: DUF177 domain-containing protein [Fimbriimonadaceae bacterium]